MFETERDERCVTRHRTAARETIFFAARAEFRCLISLGESVLSVVRPLWFICITIWSCFTKIKHVYRSMNKHEWRLTPTCLPTYCCPATFPLSDVIHTSFALLPGNSTDTFNDIYKYILRSNLRGLAPLRPLSRQIY